MPRLTGAFVSFGWDWFPFAWIRYAPKTKTKTKVSKLAHSDKEKTKKGQITGFALGEVCYGYL